VRATCGAVAKVSDTILEAGQFAQFSNLNWEFDLRHASSLNIEVLSVEKQFYFYYSTLSPFKFFLIHCFVVI
jgi:hypothetical protein